MTPFGPNYQCSLQRVLNFLHSAAHITIMKQVSSFWLECPSGIFWGQIIDKVISGMKKGKFLEVVKAQKYSHKTSLWETVQRRIPFPATGLN